MNKKWSKKKKIVAAIIIVAVLALVAAVLYIAFKPEDPTETQIHEIVQGDITETFDTTAIVQSSNQKAFAIYDGVKVKEVNVRVGDNVKKGDVLATFDTTSLNALLTEKREAYNTAQKAYNDYLDGSFSAKSQIAEIDKQISSLEKEVEKLEKIVSEEKKQSEKNDTNNSEVSKDELADLRKALNTLLGDNKLSEAVVNRLLSSDSATAQMVDALKGLMASATIDMSALQSMTGSMMSENEKLLIEKELNLVQLNVQKSMLSAQSADSLKSVYKTIADSAYKAYDEMATQVNSLNGGWIAEEDGFVREVNIKAGETYTNANTSSPSSNLDISSILASVTSGSYDISSIVSSLAGTSQSGIVVEYYPLEATFEVSKYDISKISMDQSVKVTTADGKEYDAVVNYISAVADSSGSGININSLMGAGSGSGSTITAKVEIRNADRSVIIGMDVDLSAALDTKENVTLVPVEAIQYDNENGYYVFKYNEEEKIINRQTVLVGLFDGSSYEVLDGLSVGDKIVRAPTLTMEDGQSVVPKG